MNENNVRVPGRSVSLRAYRVCVAHMALSDICVYVVIYNTGKYIAKGEKYAVGA